MRHHLFARRTVDRVLLVACGTLSAIALFALMGLTLLDVVGRQGFNHSLPGALELTEILMVLVIFGALPIVSWRDQHVVFDALDHVVPPALRRWQLRMVQWVCAGVFATLAWLLFMRAERFFDFGQTTAQLRIPIGPVAIVMGLLLLVTAIAHLLLALGLADEPSSSASNPKDPDS